MGTVTFAANGAMIALAANFDLIGCTAVGLTVAVGGGTIRDCIIGRLPGYYYILLD